MKNWMDRSGFGQCPTAGYCEHEGKTAVNRLAICMLGVLADLRKQIFSFVKSVRKKNNWLPLSEF
jgi:hypothetical protein